MSLWGIPELELEVLGELLDWLLLDELLLEGFALWSVEVEGVLCELLEDDGAELEDGAF